MQHSKYIGLDITDITDITDIFGVNSRCWVQAYI